MKINYMHVYGQNKEKEDVTILLNRKAAEELMFTLRDMLEFNKHVDEVKDMFCADLMPYDLTIRIYEENENFTKTALPYIPEKFNGEKYK